MHVKIKEIILECVKIDNRKQIHNTGSATLTIYCYIKGLQLTVYFEIKYRDPMLQSGFPLLW